MPARRAWATVPIATRREPTLVVRACLMRASGWPAPSGPDGGGQRPRARCLNAHVLRGPRNHRSRSRSCPTGTPVSFGCRSPRGTLRLESTGDSRARLDLSVDFVRQSEPRDYERPRTLASRCWFCNRVAPCRSGSRLTSNYQLSSVFVSIGLFRPASLQGTCTRFVPCGEGCSLHAEPGVCTELRAVSSPHAGARHDRLRRNGPSHPPGADAFSRGTNIDRTNRRPSGRTGTIGARSTDSSARVNDLPPVVRSYWSPAWLRLAAKPSHTKPVQRDLVLPTRSVNRAKSLIRRGSSSSAILLLVSIVLAALWAGVASAASPVLLGDQSIESLADSNDPGQAEAFPFVAGSSGTAGTVSVYVDSQSSASAVLVGLYYAVALLRHVAVHLGVSA